MNESNLITHAKRELLAVGYKPIDDCEDVDPNKWIQENILELLDVFSKQGHSGASAPYCINLFTKLANYEPLCPLNGDDSEWNLVSNNLLQNNRCSHVFKDIEKNVAYDINGYVFWHWSELENGEKYKSNFTSNKSKKIVTFPYTPSTQYVEVESFEVNKETGEKQLNSGWWETIYPEWIMMEKEL